MKYTSLTAKISCVKEPKSQTNIYDKDTAIEELTKQVKNLSQEAMYVITLNTHNMVIDVHLTSLGTLDGAIVHPRDIFRPAIQDNAKAIIVAHNHPSGETNASKEDIQLTKRLKECGKMLGITLLDSIVIGKTNHSIMEDL